MKSRAFTLLEVMVVMAILALLSGILFPVFTGAMRHAHEPTDTSNMRQIFMEIVLYEADNGDEAPPSLVDLGVYEPSHDAMKSPIDPIEPGPDGMYPANLYMFASKARSTYRISYAYLRDFEPRFTNILLLQGFRKDTWVLYRSDPGVGMLSCTWYVPPDPGDNIRNGDGYVLGAGPILRLYMDGSVRWAPHTAGWLDPPMETLFIDL